MDIQQVLDAIGKMTIAEINQVLDAIGARLDQLETKDPEARGLRAAVRSARSRAALSGRLKGSAAGVREGIRQARETGGR